MPPRETKILWIDDEMAYYAADFGLATGMAVDFAHTITSAKGKLSVFRYDLLIVDLMVTVGEPTADVAVDLDFFDTRYSGLELLTCLRKGVLQRDRDTLTPSTVPAIISSAAHSSEVHRLASELGGVWICGKPFSFEQLLDVIKQALAETALGGIAS